MSFGSGFDAYVEQSLQKKVHRVTAVTLSLDYRDVRRPRIAFCRWNPPPLCIAGLQPLARELLVILEGSDVLCFRHPACTSIFCESSFSRTQEQNPTGYILCAHTLTYTLVNTSTRQENCYVRYRGCTLFVAYGFYYAVYKIDSMVRSNREPA